jgi:hypothetical protein
MRVMYQVAEDDFRVKREVKKTKEISTPRIKDTQWRELQQDIATRLAADAQTTTYETQQGKMGVEGGRGRVTGSWRRQSPPSPNGKSAELHTEIMNKLYCSMRFNG